MVTDQQVRRLLTLSHSGMTQELAAAKAGMDRKTARKYLRSGKMPSETTQPRTWRTRPDPFEEVWEGAAADWDLWERLLTAGLPVESRTDMAFTL